MAVPLRKLIFDTSAINKLAGGVDRDPIIKAFGLLCRAGYGCHVPGDSGVPVRVDSAAVGLLVLFAIIEVENSFVAFRFGCHVISPFFRPA